MPRKVGSREGKKMASYDYYDPKPKWDRIKIPKNNSKNPNGKDKQIQGYLREVNKKKGQA